MDIFSDFIPPMNPEAEALKLRLGENTVIRDRPLNITTKHKTFQTRTFLGYENLLRCLLLVIVYIYDFYSMTRQKR